MGDRTRVECFVDGFNLYHAIAKLGVPHLKWVDLRSLLEGFADPNVHDIGNIFYFSAYATWNSGAHQRHQHYVAALKSRQVTPILGRFKEKDARCKLCKGVYKTHEEKETDVNIALWLLNEAYKNSFDEAFVVSRDSDLTPAIRLVLQEFPNKRVKVISPPNAGHSKELAGIVGKNKLASIKPIHLERNLLPAEIQDPATGSTIAKRPDEYAPPKASPGG